jgi:hypothetical protein
MESLGQDSDHLILHGGLLDIFVRLSKAFDRSNNIVHEVVDLVIVLNHLLVDHFTREFKYQVRVLAVNFQDDLCKACDQVLFNEELVEFPLFGID